MNDSESSVINLIWTKKLVLLYLQCPTIKGKCLALPINIKTSKIILLGWESVVTQHQSERKLNKKIPVLLPSLWKLNKKLGSIKNSYYSATQVSNKESS